MDGSLEKNIYARLETDDALTERTEELVVAALLDEVESCLGGEKPKRPPPRDDESAAPVRAYIDHVSVEGFRGIGERQTLSLPPGPGLTLVVGRNGSGKSSFAEALELLLTGDNQRWSAKGRAKIWKEGWRNLHRPERASLEAGILIDGVPGVTTVTRTWHAGEGLDDGEAVVVRNGSEEPLDSLGWDSALQSYRPFLSYNELGSMLDEGPAKLFDALASILGLEELVAAADALKTARSARSKAHKSTKDRLKELRASLEAHEDERASECAKALKGTKWKLDVVESLSASGAPGPEGSEVEALGKLVNLRTPSAEAVDESVAELRAAVDAAKAIEGTDAAKAKRRAELLDRAVELHRHDGDGDCPVCGSEGALDASWRKEAETEADALRAEARAADEALRALRKAEQAARELVTEPPEVLERAAKLGLDADPVVRAWKVWAETTELGSEALAEALEARAPALAEAVDALASEAKRALDEREDAWRPMARALADWLPGARRVREEAPTLDELKSAEDWIREQAIVIRNERFQPIKERVKAVWELLRSRSHVELEDVTFEGKTTSRRVKLDVNVDGTEGAALGVMSQGELHALALSLFLPRATHEESPFGFLVIDDPVQSMDPARVDGLARALHEQAKDRQIVVFTHDDRLPEAVRHQMIPARTIEVQRREGSVVELREVRSPALQYLDDARALVSTEELPKIARERVVPGLCRHAIEAACLDVVRRRRLERGESHESVEALFENHVKLLPRLALAFFDDGDKAGDVYARLKNQIGPWQIDTVKRVNEGSHKGFPGGDAMGFVRNVEQLVTALSELR